MGKWSKYFEVHRNSKQHEIVEHACAKFSAKELSEEKNYSKTALDLGCGTGRDTLYLLEKCFKVTAIDVEAEAIEIVREKCVTARFSEFTLYVSRLETVKFSEQYDLVSSNLTLSFIPPDNFKNVWSNIVQHIQFNGRFSGQFFGIHHEWSNSKDMTFFNYNEIRYLFGSIFQIESIHETAAKTKTVSDGIKFWHQWDVIALKKAINPERPIANILQMLSMFSNTRKKIPSNSTTIVKEISKFSLRD